MPSKPAPSPVRVVFYARVAQDTAASRAWLDRCKERAQAWIEQVPGTTLSEVATDIGSGNRVQPALERVLDSARARGFDLLLVRRVTDLGRSLPIIHRILDDLAICGVALHALDDPIDATDTPPYRRLVATMILTIDEHYRRTERERDRVRRQVESQAARRR